MFRLMKRSIKTFATERIVFNQMNRSGLKNACQAGLP